MRLGSFVVLAAAMGVSSSCMTTYDAQGRPVQSVDPGLAVAGVAAAGLVGYAAGNNHNDHYRRNDGYYNGGGYYRSGGYRGGYR